jgi:1,4-dihydroxy-2-naphthoate polyprenyltransferase
MAIIKALRMFSFTIALISCMLGIILAYVDKRGNLLNSILVLICGMLLQAGVNLVNDFFEYKQGKLDNKVATLNFFGNERSALEWMIYFIGLLCFAAVVPLGLFLVYRTGLTLLWIGIIGFIGGYFYTGEPFNYKRRGFAFIFVFFLMGVMMIGGSYYAVAGVLDLRSFLVSIPVSALVSLLLLSNELRDYEDDIRHNIRTLTVRIGYENSVRLYWGTVIFTYLSSVALFLMGYIPHLFFIALSIAGFLKPVKFLRIEREKRRPLTPLTARYHLIFGILFILTFIFDLKG